MMEQVQSQEYRPEMPAGVKIVAWMMLVYIMIGLLYFGLLAVTAHRGEVMFRYFGRDYLVAGLLSKALGLAVMLAVCGFAIVCTVFTLRGHMWAYGVLTVTNLMGAVSIIHELINRHFDLMGWVPFAVAWVLIRDFTAFREYARSRR